MSNFSPQDNKNYEHNVFRGINIRPNQEELFFEFANMLDVSQHTIDALILDIRKFAKWFTTANREPWDIERVTSRDVIDYRDHLKIEKKQAVSTINRNLASVRKYFKWLYQQEHITVNPTLAVKELVTIHSFAGINLGYGVPA